MNPKTRNILVMKANGMQSKAIASKIGVHVRTVEHHLAIARKELNAKTVCHAIAKAVRDGVIMAGEIGMVFILSWACFSGSVDCVRAPVRVPSRIVRREV